MSRIEIALPTKIIFSTELPVRVSDLNYGAHVGNDSILTLMQEARVILYRTLGIKNEISIEGEVGQIITDASIVYKSESFLGDILIVNLGVSDFSKYGFDMYYQLLNKATAKEVARGKTGIVCFNYEKRRIATIPDMFLQKLNSL